MTTPDAPEMDPQKTEDAQSPAKVEDSQPLFVLAGRSYLDQKILKEGQEPRLMETVRDETGNVYINKYEKLSRAIWPKLKTRPDTRPLYFVCELKAFVVIDGINVTFLPPDDFQFLGALYYHWKNDTVAEQFFNEALKSGASDAFINTGVFRYRRGERGVLDNFTLARKFLTRGLELLPQMTALTEEEKAVRRKICEMAIGEIDYRSAPWIEKLFRFIIRLLSLQFFQTDVPFIGAAAPKEPADVKIKDMTEGILKFEFEQKKKAVRKFVHDLYGTIPPGMVSLEEELAEIEKEYGGFQSPDLFEVAVIRLGEFYEANIVVFDRKAPEPAKVEASVEESESIPPPEVMCYELASAVDIERVSSKYKLVSVGELVDRVACQALEPAEIAWLIRDKADETPLMEKLFVNRSVPEHVKKTIHRHILFGTGS